MPGGAIPQSTGETTANGVNGQGGQAAKPAALAKEPGQPHAGPQRPASNTAGGKESAKGAEKTGEGAATEVAASDSPSVTRSARRSKQNSDSDSRGLTDGGKASHERGAGQPAADGTSAKAAQRPVGSTAAVVANATVVPANTSIGDDLSSAQSEASPRSRRGNASGPDVLQAPVGRGWRDGRSGQATDATEGSQLNRVDASRFVGRVARAFHFAQDRSGTLQLRLSPPELGSLRLELTVKDGALTAKLETETHAARRLLLDHLPALRDRLAEQNIRVERFDVDVGRDGQGGQRPPSSEQQAWQEQQPRQTAPARPRVGKAADSEAVRREVRETISVGSTEINAVV